MVLVDSFYPKNRILCTISTLGKALHNSLEHATEVFDDGESNDRLTIRQFLQEHVKSGSETPPYLEFSVNLEPFLPDFERGQTFIRFLMKFSISLMRRVLR